MSDARPAALLSWSGGKDAAWALHALRRRGGVEVVGLLAMVDAADGRAAGQGVQSAILRAQADACGLLLIEAPLPRRADDAAYGAAFADALERARARWPGIAEIAFGDLFLHDVRAWREALCARLGWTARFPLFDPGLDRTAALAREMIAGGLRARVVRVDTTQLDAGFAGRAFDAALLEALPPGCDPCGERGEFHTLVHAGPMFAAPLRVAAAGASREDDGRFACADFGLADGAREGLPG